MATAEEVFASNVRALDLPERLRLAALILDEAHRAAGSLIGFSDVWTNEDIEDLRTHSLKYANERYPEEEELV